MDLLRAMRPSDTLATVLGLHCNFATGWKYAVNASYCLLCLAAKVLVSVACLSGVVQHLTGSSKEELNVTNMLLLACYKATSVLLFLGIAYYHLRKHKQYVGLFQSLTDEAVRLGCYADLFEYLHNYATAVAVISVCAVWGLFFYQVTQLGLFGNNVDFLHSAVTAYATVYFELKYTIVAKSTQLLFEKVNLKVASLKRNPKMLIDTYPWLRMVHSNVYGVICDANEFFGPLLILTQMLQFQVLLYSGYVFVIACFDLEDIFARVKFEIMLISALYWVFIFSNYLHLATSCTVALQKGQETVGKLLSIETGSANVWVREEASLFREQLLHYRTLTFSISGLCTINNAYVFIVFGALATYLATLVQFHLLALQFKQEINA